MQKPAEMLKELFCFVLQEVYHRQVCIVKVSDDLKSLPSSYNSIFIFEQCRCVLTSQFVTYISSFLVHAFQMVLRMYHFVTVFRCVLIFLLLYTHAVCQLHCFVAFFLVTVNVLEYLLYRHLKHSCGQSKLLILTIYFKSPQVCASLVVFMFCRLCDSHFCFPHFIAARMALAARRRGKLCILRISEPQHDIIPLNNPKH